MFLIPGPTYRYCCLHSLRKVCPPERKGDMIESSIHVHINNISHLALKYARIFVCRHYLSQEANSFPRVLLEKNCELRAYFRPKWGLLCLLFFKSFSQYADIPQFQLGIIWSRDTFRPIVHEQKYLMDYTCK